MLLSFLLFFFFFLGIRGGGRGGEEGVKIPPVFTLFAQKSNYFNFFAVKVKNISKIIVRFSFF